MEIIQVLYKKMTTTIDTLEIKIAEAKQKLSQETRQAIDAVNWKQIILGLNNKFNSEQIEALETEVELLLCGITYPENFAEELETRLKISKVEVSSLINDMDKAIFKKIQVELENRINTKVVDTPVKTRTFVSDPKFLSLPKKVQEAISLSDWKENLYTILKKYNIAIDKIGEVEELTTKTILGSIHNDQYENNIKTITNLPQDKLSEIIPEINEKVFKNIKTAMMNSVEKEDIIPLPPYASQKVAQASLPNNTNTEYALPNKAINSIESKIPVTNSVEENVLPNIKDEDIYKEHGIEIIYNNVPKSTDTISSYVFKKPEIKLGDTKEKSSTIEAKKELYREEIPNSEKEYIESTIEIKNKIPKKQDEIKQIDIITNKLLNNTISPTIKTDYSLPKISSQNTDLISNNVSSAKPHDPYHEAI